MVSKNTESAYIDRLIPSGTTHLTPKELAGICGYSSQHIIASIDNGHLGAFQVPGKGRTRTHPRIPVALARTYLLTNSTGLEDPLVIGQFARAIASLPPRLKRAIAQEANRQLAAHPLSA